MKFLFDLLPVLQNGTETKSYWVTPADMHANPRAQQQVRTAIADFRAAGKPVLARGETVIIAAHGNSIRALIKHIDQASDEAIMEVNVPNGNPLVYELDDELRPIQHFYLQAK